MSFRSTHILEPKDLTAESTGRFFRVRFRTLDIPSVRDGVVIGRSAPVTADAMMQTLRLVSTDRFIELPSHDEVIGAIIVREGLIKRLQPTTVRGFVLQHVKPYMSATEVLKFDVDLEILLEGGI